MLIHSLSQVSAYSCNLFDWEANDDISHTNTGLTNRGKHRWTKFKHRQTEIWEILANWPLGACIVDRRAEHLSVSECIHSVVLGYYHIVLLQGRPLTQCDKIIYKSSVHRIKALVESMPWCRGGQLNTHQVYSVYMATYTSTLTNWLHTDYLSDYQMTTSSSSLTLRGHTYKANGMNARSIVTGTLWKGQ